MQSRYKVASVAVAFAILGFMLGPQAPLGAMIWPQNAHMLEAFGTPSGGTLAALMAYGVVSSIAFGLGVAFLAFGYAAVARAPVGPGLARWAHLAITWILVSWVPHDSLHQSIGSIAALAGLEWGFHFTLIVSGLVLARYFLASTGAWPAARATPSAASAVTGLQK